MATASTRSIIRKAKEDGIDTIVTCDNGIAALEQVRLAKELGMTVIVTDHHEVVGRRMAVRFCRKRILWSIPPGRLLLPICGICGGVVTYKLVQVLYERAACRAGMERYAGVAAIATVGDVMKLQDENRIIVRWGLKQIPTLPVPDCVPWWRPADWISTT